jgi:hypothetical protein
LRQHLHAVVADVSRHARNLCLGVNADVGIGNNLLDQIAKQVAGFFIRREDGFQLRHASAEEGGFLDQKNAQTLSGNIQRGA